MLMSSSLSSDCVRAGGGGQEGVRARVRACVRVRVCTCEIETKASFFNRSEIRLIKLGKRQ